DKLAARKGEPPGERVVQDIEVHIDETVDFLEWFLDEIPIEPIWLCPLRLRDPLPPGADADRPWPLYPLEPRETYVNVGFWSAVPKQPGQIEGRANRLIEEKVSELGGHKSLYSEAFYERAEFDELYGGIHLEKYKSRYDPEDRLLGLYDKTVRRQ
ncbi:FAD-binding oxidoreductase, partial [Tsukamurella sputi]